VSSGHWWCGGDDKVVMMIMLMIIIIIIVITTTVMMLMVLDRPGHAAPTTPTMSQSTAAAHIQAAGQSPSWVEVMEGSSCRTHPSTIRL
jgi:uncharacterized membrane protein YedE/YeeE